MISRFQPGKGPSRDLLRDYEPSDGTFLKHYYSRSSEPCVSAAGIIDTDPAIATVKVSRKLVPELASARPGPGAVQLLEVRGEDAPNVLTNDPGFFSHKTGEADVDNFSSNIRTKIVNGISEQH